MSRIHTRICVAAAASLLLLPAIASADDWANTLYSEQGIELRADERVFTLFAALNELGHDDAPVTRESPVPRREFDPVRQAVRDAVGLTPQLRGKFEAFFDKNPLSLRTYTAYALALGKAPEFKVPEKLPAELAPLKGFEALLAEFHAQAKIGPIFDKVQPNQREALKSYQKVVDGPIAEARKILKAEETEDSPGVVVIVNLLDGRGSSFGVGTDDTIFLVVGPAGATADPVPLAKAFARVELEKAAQPKNVATLKGGKELLAEVRSSGFAVGADTVADYVAENLARVVAIKAVVPAEESSRALQAEVRRGFVLVGDLNRGLALFAKSPKPMPVFLSDFLREVDAGKAVAALRGN